MPVFWKAALCALSVPFFVSASPEMPTVGPNNPNIAKVSCIAGTGTAFRVGKDYWLSVKHVTHIGGCSVDGEAISELWESPTQDFAIFKLAPRKGKALAIDCDGFVAGRRYDAIGHARGADYQTSVPLTATGHEGNGFQILRGIVTVIPGQSGGVLQDRITKKAVGAVNVFNPLNGASGSLALRDTPVCQ